MKRLTLSVAAPLAAALVLAAATAEAAVREETVRCGKRPKIESAIEKALRKASLGDEIKILLVGTCKESPTIAADNITIQSKKKRRSKRATIEGTINIVGARRARVTQLKIRGGGSGINIRDGATADIEDNDVENNERNGVAVTNGSFVRVINNRIRNNGVASGAADVGLEIIQSSVRSWGNEVSGNGVAAVRVSSFGRFHSGILLGPGGTGREQDRDVLIQRGCGRGQAAGSCGAPNTGALRIFSTAIAELTNGDLTGEADVDRGSNLSYQRSTVNGRVSIGTESLLGVSSDVFGSGDVNCVDGSTDFYGSAGFSCTSSFPSPP